MKRFLRHIIKFSLIGLSILLISIPLSWLIIQICYAQKIFSVAESKSKRVAIVFGAGLQRDGSPTLILKDRVETAVGLLNENKIEKILFSGDNRFDYYNEPESMLAYAIELGARKENIILDYAGRRTYDTCYRAKYIFKVNEAILVTQNFHLPRALFLCNQIGIDAVGVKADIHDYSKRASQMWLVREVFATFSAVWDIYVRKPIPVMGEELPIFNE